LNNVIFNNNEKYFRVWPI